MKNGVLRLFTLMTLAALLLLPALTACGTSNSGSAAQSGSPANTGVSGAEPDEKIWCGIIILCAITCVELIYIYKTSDVLRILNRTYDRQLSVNSDCNMLYLYLASDVEKGSCCLTDIYTCVDATGNALTENCPERGGACIPEMFTVGGWVTGSPHMAKRLDHFGQDAKKMYVCRENTGLSPEDFARFTGLYLTEINRIETGYGTFVIYDGN